jgi:hypothetical protein
MVSKGLQTLPDIVRGSELPPSQVKQALLLLIQQNYVAAYLHKEDPSIKTSRPPYSLYEPRIDRMLHIIRCQSNTHFPTWHGHTVTVCDAYLAAAWVHAACAPSCPCRLHGPQSATSAASGACMAHDIGAQRVGMQGCICCI